MASTPTPKTQSLSNVFYSAMNPTSGISAKSPLTPTGGSTPSMIPPNLSVGTANVPTVNSATPAPVTPSTANPNPTPSLFNSSGANSGAGAAAPVATPPTGQGQGQSSSTPSPWINPSNGQVMTPEEIAAGIANKMSAPTGTSDVGQMAMNEFNPNQSSASIMANARNINNTRNDIASGNTDPYKVASQSGVAYTPAELSAIEKAYGGVYDPALNSALTKLQMQQSIEKANIDEANTEKQLALKAKLDANQPYTLSPGQGRYDAQGNAIAGGTNSSYVPGQDPAVDAYVTGLRNGTYTIADVPEYMRNQVATGLASNTQGGALSTNTTNTISAIDALLGSKGLGAISGYNGALNPLTYLPGGDAADARNKANQLKSILSIENRSALKGQGHMSNWEFKLLGDASSALGIGNDGKTNLSPEDFTKGLNKLKLKLQVGPTNLPDDELQYLQTQGYTPDQIRAYSQTQMLNPQGTTSDTSGFSQ